MSTGARAETDALSVQDLMGVTEVDRKVRDLTKNTEEVEVNDV